MTYPSNEEYKKASAHNPRDRHKAIRLALIPYYGKRGMGILHPKKAIYNRVYHLTTFGLGDIIKASFR